MRRLPINLSFTVSLLLLTSSAFAQRPYSPELPDARVETYRTTDQLELRLWFFEPEGHSADDSRPAIVFFFYGGWNAGSPGQFKQQSRYLTDRDMVAAVADYRVRKRNGTLANVAVSDAKAAVHGMDTFLVSLGWLEAVVTIEEL